MPVRGVADSGQTPSPSQFRAAAASGGLGVSGSELSAPGRAEVALADTDPRSLTPEGDPVVAFAPWPHGASRPASGSFDLEASDVMGLGAALSQGIFRTSPSAEQAARSWGADRCDGPDGHSAAGRDTVLVTQASLAVPNWAPGAATPPGSPGRGAHLAAPLAANLAWISPPLDTAMLGV